MCSVGVIPPFDVGVPDTESDFFLRGGGATSSIPCRYFGVFVYPFPLAYFVYWFPLAYFVYTYPLPN